MNRALLTNVSLFARNRLLLSPQTLCQNPNPSPIRFALSTRSGLGLGLGLRLFSSDQGSSKDDSIDDVTDEELKARIEQYFKGSEEALPSIFEAILRRKLSGKYEETDDILLRQMRILPLKKVPNNDFEQDFDKTHGTDREIHDLYDPKGEVVKKIMEDEYFYMDDKKWNELVTDGIKHGIVRDTKQCEEILEEMLSLDKLLPDDIKVKIEEKFSEVGDMCERGELEPEEAYELFKEFEDKLVEEYTQKLEAEGPPKDDENGSDKKRKSIVPQGVGPILRWKTRVVIAPGGNSWHPKNRLVKLYVTVKELGLSKYQFHRLRELVGKRYHSGKDELVITSERFEHREENRKDCLRTLLSLIEEAKKADKLVDDAQAAYVKERLREKPEFMERLQAKAKALREFNIVHA